MGELALDTLTAADALTVGGQQILLAIAIDANVLVRPRLAVGYGFTRNGTQRISPAMSKPTAATNPSIFTIVIQSGIELASRGVTSKNPPV